MWFSKLTRPFSPVFPTRCEQCGLTFIAPERGIWCQDCARLFHTPELCLRCGLPLPACGSPLPANDGQPQTIACGECLRQPPAWDKLVCIGDYRRPLSSYIQKMKYRRQFWYATSLAQLLAQHISAPPQIITYVPQHWQKRLYRGFNQSELLAQYLAQHMNLPIVSSLFHRTRAGRPQQGLTKPQRQANVHRAFQLIAKPTAAHIAIVDDVVTTGATVQQLATLLRQEEGVVSVDIYCLARTTLDIERPLNTVKN